MNFYGPQVFMSSLILYMKYVQYHYVPQVTLSYEFLLEFEVLEPKRGNNWFPGKISVLHFLTKPFSNASKLITAKCVIRRFCIKKHRFY